MRRLFCREATHAFTSYRFWYFVDACLFLQKQPHCCVLCVVVLLLLPVLRIPQDGPLQVPFLPLKIFLCFHGDTVLVLSTRPLLIWRCGVGSIDAADAYIEMPCWFYNEAVLVIWRRFSAHADPPLLMWRRVTAPADPPLIIWRRRVGYFDAAVAYLEMRRWFYRRR